MSSMGSDWSVSVGEVDIKKTSDVFGGGIGGAPDMSSAPTLGHFLITMSCAGSSINRGITSSLYTLRTLGMCCQMLCFT